MNTRYKLSVVIVTKNRAGHLEKCLDSITQQTLQPYEVVVVDNNSTDATPEVIKKWKRQVKFSVRRVLEKGSGYPRIYNKGISESKGDWVVFIDDDCIAEKEWLASAATAMKRRQLDVVLGKSLTQKPQNVYSLAVYLFQEDWKKKWIRGKVIRNFEVLDNKNIAYRKGFLDQHHLRYDEKRMSVLGGAAEDCELGARIQEKGGKAVFVSQMIVSHADPQNWEWYWKKYFKSLAAFMTFQGQVANQNVKPELHSFRQLLNETADQYHYGFFKRKLFMLLVYSTVVMSMILKRAQRVPVLQQKYIEWCERL